jgi:hypothetical protein
VFRFGFPGASANLKNNSRNFSKKSPKKTKKTVKLLQDDVPQGAKVQFGGA